MPRNIETLVDKYIEENNFELFVLTFAIQSGIAVPPKMLERFGTSYGFDNFFHSFLGLQGYREELSRFNKHIDGTERFDKEVEKLLNEKYERELYKYKRHNEFYRAQMKNLGFMMEKIIPLKSSDNLQIKFKAKLSKYISAEIKQLEELIMKNQKPLIMNAMQFAINERRRLKKLVLRIEKELLIDPAFCCSLEKDWLKLNIHQKINNRLQKDN